MKIFSACFFFFFLSVSIQALDLAIPKFAQDAAASVESLFQSSHESISGLLPPDFDFWRSAEDLGDKANAYTADILNDAAVQYEDKIKEIKEIMNRVVTSAEGMETILKDVDLKEFQKLFEVKLSHAFEKLKKDFSEPLPEDQTERYRQQAATISQVLDTTEDTLVAVCALWNIPEADVRTKFADIKSHMNHALLIIVNLVLNEHPVLFTTLAVSAVILVIPKSFFLRPIFGLLGFGPLGPVKGTFATSSQRFFFGAAVVKGSWFSTLQRVGMKMVL
ncbi:hypothetical protein BYT27DRAFT_7163324 [Phlegmacium glaucopus]|nr:hypothetical protein BYT27DRAFT_7163324 [Phlegmacium glaucopus]